MQNSVVNFMDLYMKRKSSNNRICGANDNASTQNTWNVTKADKMIGRFNSQFKIYAICRVTQRTGESDDSILLLSKEDVILPSMTCIEHLS
ncbi:40S ribosomal protein S21 [Galemys pyrenaicus]|uniref:40S ribosomal protein S21 n=1 Tax=Galemys pyrenaicus TaxID=202257 RepID=A0A8J5ZFU4_GALPY|nr:40S ribosomal protein S21 [Galemys pyrenaicus]